jgi:heme-degrading monooxygenase HmoA
MQFKLRWRNRTSRLAGCDGFISFDLLRRDIKAKGHGIAPVGGDKPLYMTCTIWRDRAAFEGWRTGSAFGEAHGSSGGGKEKGGEQPQKPPTPLWSRPPVLVFYEGTLVISSPKGV